MSYGIEDAEMIQVDQVFLDHENPRHEPYETQEEVVQYLTTDEYVLQLAKDIVKNGLNPLELFALIPAGNEQQEHYIVAEGNRRMCAIKLLNDPDLAPPDKRKEFEKISKQFSGIPEIFAIVFKSKEDVSLWVDRTHGGLQGGIGRKTWDADQKARHIGGKKNIAALNLLNYAEKNGLISSKDRKGKLTTVQRYLSNSVMREAIGLDASNPNELSITRPREEFATILQKFITDLLSGDVNSRKNKDGIIEYSRQLSSLEGLSNTRTSPEFLFPGDSEGQDSNSDDEKPEKPKPRRKIPYNKKIHDSLKDIPSYKLDRIYYSLCEINLKNHTPLLVVGLWAFIETLTALCGREDKTDFVAYLSAVKLKRLGIGDTNRETKAIRQAITRIAELGNTTKHHHQAASFNGEQMANDVETISNLLLALSKEAHSKNVM